MTTSYLEREEPKDVSKAFKRLKKRITIDNLWMYILRLLQEKEMYGYEIRESIKKQFGFEPATITSYTILHRLQEDNLVMSFVKDNPEGRPDRKYYTITEDGERAMQDAKRFLNEILTRVFDKTKTE
ncbi:MAG: PadR family transcriptional regulator [Candidatus Heimdallarchaeota archaeon]|nr:MAG: PadR family transcriptional regulator [Candidatus Gerdarchaeota archaeon]RLI74030.1 MAG: PadR family transcriptional regulator [Candidatus Heimdallarchaeota archaeon]